LVMVNADFFFIAGLLFSLAIACALAEKSRAETNINEMNCSYSINRY